MVRANHSQLTRFQLFQRAGLLIWMIALSTLSFALIALAMIAGGVLNRTNRVVFENRRADIYLMQADGSRPTRLVHTIPNKSEVVLSPDETKIAFFAQDADGNHALYSMTIGGAPLRIATGDGARVTWSPQSDRLAFVHLDDIFIVNADGSNLTNITNSAAKEERPVWSPINNVILFKSGETGSNELYTVNADGSDYQQLSAFDDPRMTIISLTWSPDARKIAFIALNNIYVVNASDGSIQSVRSTGNPGAKVVYWFTAEKLVYFANVQGWTMINADATEWALLDLDWNTDNRHSFSAVWKSPPLIPYLPPIADAGEDRQIVAADGLSAQVTLDASGSYSEQGEIEFYTWEDPSIEPSFGKTITVDLKVGTHPITLRVTDNRSYFSTDHVVITVIAGD